MRPSKVNTRTTSGQLPSSLARKLDQKFCEGVIGKPSTAYWMARLNKAFQGCRPPQDLRLNSKAWSHVSTAAAAVIADFGARTGIVALVDGAVCAGVTSP